jgi:hypothetical protein
MTKNLELPQLNPNETLKELPKKDKKFCSSCSLMKPDIGGEMVVTTRKRWRCAQCKARTSLRKYSSKIKSD